MVYRGRLLIVSQKVNRKYRNEPFPKPLVLEIEFKLKKKKFKRCSLSYENLSTSKLLSILLLF